MKKLNDSIKKIVESPNGKAKESVLSSQGVEWEDVKQEKFHVFNTPLKDVLAFIFDESITTNIAKKKVENTIDNVEAEKMFDTLYEFMGYLSTCTGKNEQLEKVCKHIKYYNNIFSSDFNFLHHLAIKKITGVTITHFNKVFSDTPLLKFQVQQAHKYKDTKNGSVVYNTKEMEGKEIIITNKIDGERCEAFVEENNGEVVVTLKSRNGKVMLGYTEITEQLKKLPKGLIYEGEIQAIPVTGKENSQELFKMTTSITRSKGEKTGVQFIVYDLIPISHFNKGEYPLPTYRRKEILKKFVESHKSSHVVYCEPLYEGIFSHDIVDEITKKNVDNGEEGTMVQLRDGAYKNKRHNGLLKVKLFPNADVRVVGVYEGKEGKNIGRLGGLIVDFKGFDVRVGTGFNDHQREKYFNEPKTIVGKIVSIDYFEEFTNDEGEIDLRFASFKGERDDKKSPSYY